MAARHFDVILLITYHFAVVGLPLSSNIGARTCSCGSNFIGILADTFCSIYFVYQPKDPGEFRHDRGICIYGDR